MRTLMILSGDALTAGRLRSALSAAFADDLRLLCCDSVRRVREAASRTAMDILVIAADATEDAGQALCDELRKARPDCAVICLGQRLAADGERPAPEEHVFACLPRDAYEGALIEAVGRAMAYLSPDAPPAPKVRSARGDAETWVPRLNGYICAHLSGDVSLNALADYCHFHPVYLSRAYREATGTTISGFINRAKQDRAQRLLRMSDYSVHEISMRMGFATDNYFCRWFKKRTGMTPHAYRELARREA